MINHNEMYRKLFNIGKYFFRDGENPHSGWKNLLNDGCFNSILDMIRVFPDLGDFYKSIC